MKRLLMLFCAIAIAVGAYSQPLLVGHRGSLWGVANTAEAFINGAKKGYHYLECDVKVTSDGVHIISHDDDTSTYGDKTLSIASSTLAQLKEVTLTQTRSGVTYTGKLCTLSEYLDICAEYNVLPVIELKWATGINSNDTSGIPALIAEIESKGFRSKCIILTSMKPCLEYIRTNYPDITLQFLTGQYWASHFDWCVEKRMDVDIQAGYFDKSTVTKFHDAGLKVNMWTANTNENYSIYGNYGCDFITTDYLDPANLPELNADVTFPPNTVDYPNVEAGVIKGMYFPEKVADVNMPSMFDGMTVKRALLRDSKWYILALDADNFPILTIIDPETGKEIKRMNIMGVSGGSIALNDIAFSADGVLLGCNKAIIPFAGGGDVWKIYKWVTDDAVPELFASIDTADKLGNWDNVVAGISFAVSGRINDLQLYTLTCDATNATAYCVAGIKTDKGVVITESYAFDEANYTTEKWGDDVSIMVTPFSRDNLIVDSRTMAAKEYTFMWDGTTPAPMKEYAMFADGLFNPPSIGLNFLRYGMKVYGYFADCDDSNVWARMYDVTDGIAQVSAVSNNVPEGKVDVTKGYVNTAIEHVDGNIFLYVIAQGSGLTKYAILPDNEYDGGNTGTVDFAFELLWQNSTVTNSAPANIDGTNAQQGAAFNGLFYVNNCVDEKLYVFDKTGCLGGIDGGAGWGTACDDAGNVIVRNDKDAGAVHSFIIYPSGTTVENPGTPVRFEVTVPLEGQTNFISASGNVLGEYGNIYMYPNKQNAINIVSMADGKVTAVKASKEITLSGTAAGYVIPIDNNSENWIYHVRSTGFYTYNGGQCELLFSGRSSTTAPARNTTGGGDYFSLSGHNILLHNSGANYKGGFTVRDMTTDAVIASVDPIGTLGYVSGGNYSTFNWLFAEKIDAGSYYIYQYCPANGMAVYRLWDKNYTSIEVVDADEQAMSVKVFPNPVVSVLNVVSSENISEISIRSVSGAEMRIDNCIIIDNQATINVEELPAGIYLLTTSKGSKAVKFVKK